MHLREGVSACTAHVKNFYLKFTLSGYCLHKIVFSIVFSPESLPP